MSKLIAAVALACLSTSAGADPVTVARTVDLDRPGALEALRQSNPVHHETVRKIVDGVVHRPDAAVSRWIAVTFGGRDVTYAPIVLTSHPPQRRLAFALGDTRYVTVITLTNVRGRIVPADP